MTGRRRLSAGSVLKLLEDQEFCDGAYAFLRQMADFAETNADPDARTAFALDQVQPFLARRGVPPPAAPELVAPDYRRPAVSALASGRWGIISVFPWTTEHEVRKAARAIRRAVATRQRDADTVRRAQLAGWLEDCGFDRSEIARSVWGRTKGLRRPSRAAAIARMPDREEVRQLAELQRLGLSRRAAESRLYRRARGSEPTATATVRMAERRYLRAVEALNRDLAAPRMVEPKAHALTMLFRALGEASDAEIRRRTEGLRQTFIENGA